MNTDVDHDSVTAHAVVRFCQRVLDVPEIDCDGNPTMEMHAHCNAAGLRVDQVKAMILTDKVRALIGSGKQLIAEPLFVVLVQNSRVISILQPRQKRPMKQRTKRQIHADMARLNRRAR
jgi:hypothetical protein